MFKIYEEKTKLDDNNVWKQLQELHTVPINKYIYNLELDYNSPYRYAVVNETEIPVYSCDTDAKSFNLANFKNASCCKFRSDGDVVLVGTKSGDILITSTKMHGKIFHSIKAHKKIITKIEFLYKFEPIQTKSVSISDDGTVQVWDITTRTRLHLFTHSKEPLRGLAVSKANPNIFATGSFDNFIRIYNIEENNSIFTQINTQKQINCLLFPFDSNTNFILSAEKSSLFLWDISAPGEDIITIPIQSATPHHMQINDMCVADGLCTGDRVIFTAGMDGMVKVIALSNFEELYKYEYSSNLMSIRVLPNCQGMVVSGNDSSDQTKNWIYTRKFRPATKICDQPDATTSSEQTLLQKLNEKYCLPHESVTVIPSGAYGIKHSRLDKMLRQHKYRAILTIMLSDKALLTQPYTIKHFMGELYHYGALQRTLAGQSDVKINHLMRYMRVLITKHDCASILKLVMDYILDLYPIEWLRKLQQFRKVQVELERSVDKWKRLDEALVGVNQLLFLCQSTKTEKLRLFQNSKCDDIDMLDAPK